MNRSHVYFVGVGGIGMSALARYFNRSGKQVAGYDRTISDLTKRLQSEGISITYVDEADTVPFPYRDKNNTLVVYTPAIPESSPILTYFREHEFECLKRAEVLGRISRDLPTIAVAGTHGKTTVSSMLAYLMHKGGVRVNAFLGGISRDFGTNLVLDSEAQLVVTEADEFDRSFLHLSPKDLVITSIDVDHLDVYEDEEDLHKTYAQLIDRVQENGVVISKPDVLSRLKPENKVEKVTYHLKDRADVYASNVSVEEGCFVFDYNSAEVTIKNIRCGLPGLHNIENAVAAIYLSLRNGVSSDVIASLMSEFHGVKRRFDVHIQRNDFVYIDDYAHHPSEIKALHESVRELFPKKKITAIFQPHLYSRTRDFGDEFAKELAQFDELILLELYPAREEPIEGITSLWLAKKTHKENVPVCQAAHLINILKEREVEVLLTIGAGNIDQMVEPLINHYER